MGYCSPTTTPHSSPTQQQTSSRRSQASTATIWVSQSPIASAILTQMAPPTLVSPLPIGQPHFSTQQVQQHLPTRSLICLLQMGRMHLPLGCYILVLVVTLVLLQLQILFLRIPASIFPLCSAQTHQKPLK